MKRVAIQTRSYGALEVEATFIKGPLAVTRALAAPGSEDIYVRGRECWTVTHLRTGYSITRGLTLKRRDAIAWLERALKANNWARETAKTWARRSLDSKFRIWVLMSEECL